MIGINGEVEAWMPAELARYIINNKLIKMAGEIGKIGAGAV